MKLKDKIWDKEKHWFKFKFRLIFLALGIICTIIKVILLFTINPEENVGIFFLLIILELIFYAMFLGAILEKFY